MDRDHLPVYGHKLKCMKDEGANGELWGNYQASYAANLVIAFSLCDSTTSTVPCKTPKQITDWM